MSTDVGQQAANESQPIASAPRQQKKPKRTKTHRDAAKERTSEMWDAINETRKDIAQSIGFFIQ